MEAQYIYLIREKTIKTTTGYPILIIMTTKWKMLIVGISNLIQIFPIALCIVQYWHVPMASPSAQSAPTDCKRSAARLSNHFTRVKSRRATGDKCLGGASRIIELPVCNYLKDDLNYVGRNLLYNTVCYTFQEFLRSENTLFNGNPVREMTLFNRKSRRKMTLFNGNGQTKRALLAPTAAAG